MIRIKRVYDAPDRADGARFLVDRVWPRGIKKAKVALDGWLKDVAPSTKLRKWFAHDPRKWDEFQRRYETELAEKEKDWGRIVKAEQKGNVTLIYGAKDSNYNNAAALKNYLAKRR
jgi:uncharacterized protein YeaO (DUF488 family)